MQTLTIRRPDDWHVHFRDGPLLKQVVPFTARQFARAIVMPNLTPPVVNAKIAAAYRQRILAAVPAGIAFEPLMTCYLTDATDSSDLVAGHRDRIFTAAKLYPAHATTNSAHGVTDIKRLHPVLSAMEQNAIPLLVHGEYVHPDVDIFDRESAFIERVLQPTLASFPRLKIVLEHVTTSDGVEVVRANRARMAATLTPQHLLFNRNVIFQDGIRPHMYCLPVLKREKHRLALRAAATSGESCFFLGTDSAPHLRHLKEAECGCAGVFSAPVALQAYLRVFAEENALAKFEAFASLNGPAFYGLPVNESRITLMKKAAPAPGGVKVKNLGEIVPLFAGEHVDWSVG